ncbi:MAG TPA: (d)CMP kinase [Phycisphaerales bacterium]|nr:(d)CMP kinase [Phycisphaerales bacterium]HRQ75931.1 (d)CMP kinase [Phycisphaerales bacterium]
MNVMSSQPNQRSTPALARERLIITIDGPAGTGKSTVAHGLATRLGLEFLDTGAMYRAAAAIALEQNIDPAAPGGAAKLARAVEEANLHFDWKADPPRIMLGDRDVTRRIRDLDVSEIVSIVAAQPEIRRIMVMRQRGIAQRHPRLVSEGRDQGSVVFPEACVRFYLHADVNVRADRRRAQLERSGQTVGKERVVQDILQRDQLDASRTDGPLVRPEGAIDIDTGERSVDEVVDAMEAIVRREVHGLGA